MYTVILGAANSGKTCLFLEQMTNKIIISVVDVEKIFDSIDTMNKYSFDYINIRMDNNNMSGCIHELFARNGKLNILVDEIHFFTGKEHVHLVESLNENWSR
jgi:thymidine kinase